MLLENGFAKRSADYAAGKVVDESIGVPGAWGMIKSTTAKQAFEEYLKGSSEEMVTKMLKKMNGKIPGADDIKYAGTETSKALEWAVNILNTTSELNGIRDYRATIKAQGGLIDDKSLELSKQNIASIEYLEQLVTNGTLMDMVESFNANCKELTLHKDGWRDESYKPFMTLGDWGAELTDTPYELRMELSSWTSVQSNYTQPDQYWVKPEGVLYDYWYEYSNNKKHSDISSKYSWTWSKK